MPIKKITITNDNTYSIQLELHISQKFHFPDPIEDKQFRAIVWPQEITPEEVMAADSISNKLQEYLEYGTETSGLLKISIGPNEKFNFTIGTLHPILSKYYVSPDVLFVDNEKGIFEKCDSHMSKQETTVKSMKLGLGLNIPNYGCMTVPCGIVK